MRNILSFLLILSLTIYQKTYADSSNEVLEDEGQGGQGTIDPIVVETNHGKIQGNMKASRDGRNYYEFLSVPFAMAERFQAPQELGSYTWEGVLDGTQYKSGCIHFNYKTKQIKGEEDCLYLNVYTPRLSKEGEHKMQYPVMVYLHSAGFAYGSGGDVRPDYLMDKDVIVVTVNYRLGAFGFLNTKDMYSQGNFGLKDQVVALKWVKDNIETFSGDKDRVTLWGFGGGAASAMYHLSSPMSKGLFSSAILQSGESTATWAFNNNPVKSAKDFGKMVECPTDSSSNLVNCLKGMTAEDIFNKMTNSFNMYSADDDFFGFEMAMKACFAPSAEKLLEGQTESDVFLTESPVKTTQDGKFVNRVPVLISAVLNEAYIKPVLKLMNSTEKLEKLNNNWDMYAKKVLLFDEFADEPSMIYNKAKDFYFEDRAISTESIQNFTNMISDRFFTAPLKMGAYHMIKADLPVYIMFNTYEPETTCREVLDYDRKKFPGMGHGDDIQFLFKLPLYKMPEIKKDSKDYDISKKMVDLFTSFAENGKPTKLWGDVKEWTKVEKDDAGKKEMTVLKIKPDGNTKMMKEPDFVKSRFEFWMTVLKKYVNMDKLLDTGKEQFDA